MMMHFWLIEKGEFSDRSPVRIAEGPASGATLLKGPRIRGMRTFGIVFPQLDIVESRPLREIDVSFGRKIVTNPSYGDLNFVRQDISSSYAAKV